MRLRVEDRAPLVMCGAVWNERRSCQLPRGHAELLHRWRAPDESWEFRWSSSTPATAIEFLVVD